LFDPFSTLSRLWSASLDMAQVGRHAAETLTASNEVIRYRAALMKDATIAPLDADHVEFGRMVPEKLEAFSRAGMAIANEGWAMQRAFMSESQHIGSVMMMGGWLPTPAAMGEIAARQMDYAADRVERAAALGLAVVKPIHARATSNARRLKSKAEQR